MEPNVTFTANANTLPELADVLLAAGAAMKMVPRADGKPPAPGKVERVAADLDKGNIQKAAEEAEAAAVELKKKKAAAAKKRRVAAAKKKLEEAEAEGEDDTPDDTPPTEAEESEGEPEPGELDPEAVKQQFTVMAADQYEDALACLEALGCETFGDVVKAGMVGKLQAEMVKRGG